MKGKKHSLIKILMETLRKSFKVQSPSQIMNKPLEEFRKMEKNKQEGICK